MTEKISVGQLKAARALLEMSQKGLSEISGVSLPTVQRLEAAGGMLGGARQTSERLISALEAAGVEFIPENGGGAGVRLRKAGAAAQA